MVTKSKMSIFDVKVKHKYNVKVWVIEVGTQKEKHSLKGGVKELISSFYTIRSRESRLWNKKY